MKEQEVTYASFWTRTKALIIDAFVVGMLSGAINFYNILEIKSFWLYLIMAVIGMLYKPFMEHFYCATLGKMAMKIKVVSYDFERISLDASFLRSIFQIVPVLFSIPIYYSAFNNEELMLLNDFLDFMMAFSAAYPSLSMMSNISFAIFGIELVLFFTDSEKKNRSLHDRIARSCVVRV